MRRLLLLALTSSVTWAVTFPYSIEGNRLNHEFAREYEESLQSDITVVEAPRQITSSQKVLESEFILSSGHLSGALTEPEYFENILQGILKPYIGRMVTLDVVYTVAELLEQEFRKEGFILARVIVPAPKIQKAGTHIEFEAHEGKLVSYKVSAINPALQNKLGEFLAPLMDDAIAVDEKFEKQILLAGSAPGITVKALVKQDEQTPGNGEVELQAERSPSKRYVKISNKGNDFIGPGYVQVGLEMNSLLGLDRLDMSYATSAPDTSDMQHFGVDYTYVLPSSGMQFHTAGQVIKTLPGSDLLEDQGLEGKAIRWQLDATKPMIRSKNYNVWASGGGYWIDSKYNVVNQNTQLYEDRIAAFFIELKEKYASDHGRGVHLKMRATAGVDLADFEQDLVTSRSVAVGRTDYFKLNADLEAFAALGYDINFNMKFGWQYATTPLLLAEQFNVRSDGFGQGYDIAELSGDRGWRSTFEFSWQGMPNIWIINDITPYVFYDLARLSNIDLLRAPPRHIASMGFGSRMKFMEYFEGNIMVADPVYTNVYSTGNRHPRIFFEVMGKV